MTDDLDPELVELIARKMATTLLPGFEWDGAPPRIRDLWLHHARVSIILVRRHDRPPWPTGDWSTEGPWEGEA